MWLGNAANPQCGEITKRLSSRLTHNNAGGSVTFDEVRLLYFCSTFVPVSKYFCTGKLLRYIQVLHLNKAETMLTYADVMLTYADIRFLI
jgi:hypothetical protein